YFFFSSRRRHTRFSRDWSSDVCSSDLGATIRTRIYCARKPDRANPAPVLLYMHGGGFVVGGLDSHQSLCRGLATESGAAVLAIRSEERRVGKESRSRWGEDAGGR